MKKTIVYVSLLVNLILVVTSYLFNMGWLRFFAILGFVPYTIVLTIFNFRYAYVSFKTAFSMKTIKVLALTNGFYLLANILMPDGGDVGELYACFGLIKSDVLGSILYNVSLACLIVHILFFTRQIKEMTKMKKTLK
jgi:uncharacterized membrane protein